MNRAQINQEGPALRRELLAWFDQHHRDLPWRHVGDPYAVWVSEIMLQQTRVATVVDYFQRWMVRFPTVAKLAAASQEEVLELWSGLGYYRRARALHRAAKMVVDDFDSQIPASVPALRKLPGVGPYTAGAVASIAFGRVEPLVDGNVIRLLTRLFAIGGDPARAPTKNEIWAIAGELVDADRPGDFNQALMEMGSEVCVARSPRCGECPVRRWCAALEQGEPTAFPEIAKRRPPKAMRGRCAVVVDDSEGEVRLLVRRRPDEGLLAGLWEFPSVEQEGSRWPTLAKLSERLRPAVGEVSPGRSVGTVEHIFSHRKLKMRVHWLTAAASPITIEDFQWVHESDLSDLATSALVSKVDQVWRQQSLL